MKSLKVKINLDYNQEMILNTLSNEHRLLYNYLLENVIKSNLDFKNINNLQRDYRKLNHCTINAKSSQNTAISLINNIKSFLSLNKKDTKARFPKRFKSYKFFTTFMLDFNNGNGGFKVLNNKLTLNLLSCSSKSKKFSIVLPEICKVITENNVKTITFKKEGDKHYLIFVYSEKDSNIFLPENGNLLSIDLGLSNIVTCFSNSSDSFAFKNERNKGLEKQVSKLQGKLDIKIKNSVKYRKLKKTFTRLSNKLKNKNKDFQHKVSKKVIDNCIENNINTLILGDIKTKKLVKDTNRKIENEDFLKRRKRIKQEKGLNKSTQSRGTLSRLKTFLEYKAKNVGINFYLINEYNTSKTNCLTDKVELDSALGCRIVKLMDNLFIDRDLNSAINMAKKCKATWLSHLDVLIDNIKFHKMYLDSHSNMIKLGY